MTHWKVLTSSSATLTADDLGKHRPTFLITAVEGGEFKDEDDKTTGRAALLSIEPVKNENPSAAESAFWDSIEGKRFAARPVNCMLIEAMFGAQFENWVGHRLTIGPDKVEDAFKGALMGKPCIRVFGSPEIDGKFKVELRLPRKKAPLVRYLTPTPNRTADSPVVNEKAVSSASGAADDTGAAEAIAFEKGPES